MSDEGSSGVVARSKSILELDENEALAFLLKGSSYCNIDLPSYIKFDDLLDELNKYLAGKTFKDLISKPRDYEDVNYTLFNNKDGKYAWRPFQLVHPALYVSLVHQITNKDNWEFIKKRFDEFAKNQQINCLSLPVISLSDEKDKAEQISNWWHNIEQKSIELALDYDYIFETDITDCYGAIYTHSIAWALHSKVEAKAKRRDMTLLGNVVDAYIQDMRHGQTNGIPQGSVLMDLIAEFILGYADLELSEKIKSIGVSNYQILRYRDDYRIFVNNPQDGELLVKMLTEITIGLGLKLNPSKTKSSSDVVRSSIKDDKFAWFSRKKIEKSLQKHLFIIHDHAIKYPNSGSLVVALLEYNKRLVNISKPINDVIPLISIVVDISYRNPRTYTLCSSIISKLLSYLKEDEQVSILSRIRNKFEKLPNTGHLQIWLQRISYAIDNGIKYQEPFCELVVGDSDKIWNNDWISSKDLLKIIDAKKIIDNDKLQKISPILPLEEVELFIVKHLEEYGG